MFAKACKSVHTVFFGMLIAMHYVIFNCHHFATDCLHAVKILIFYCHHFQWLTLCNDHLHVVQTLIFYCDHLQLSSLCNWPSSGVCSLYNIPSLGVKGTSSVLWSSANFCSISQNMHYKVPVASQHWNTNQVVLTWKDDWPPWRTSTYKRPFTQEGNYLVFDVVI